MLRAERCGDLALRLGQGQLAPQGTVLLLQLLDPLHFGTTLFRTTPRRLRLEQLQRALKPPVSHRVELGFAQTQLDTGFNHAAVRLQRLEQRRHPLLGVVRAVQVLQRAPKPTVYVLDESSGRSSFRHGLSSLLGLSDVCCTSNGSVWATAFCRARAARTPRGTCRLGRSLPRSAFPFRERFGLEPLVPAASGAGVTGKPTARCVARTSAACRWHSRWQRASARSNWCT